MKISHDTYYTHILTTTILSILFHPLNAATGLATSTLHYDLQKLSHIREFFDLVGSAMENWTIDLIG